MNNKSFYRVANEAVGVLLHNEVPLSIESIAVVPQPYSNYSQEREEQTTFGGLSCLFVAKVAYTTIE